MTSDAADRLLRPELVADAILAAAARPRRDIVVGGSGRLISMAAMAPRLTDAYMERTLSESQQTDNRYQDAPTTCSDRSPATAASAVTTGRAG